ncbi:hypothetical protein BC940DRAFT_323833 [Gongronella butleri]|nr:hypothetical protein BC940DRAFT_323833 [Gongronella butleri]
MAMDLPGNKANVLIGKPISSSFDVDFFKVTPVNSIFVMSKIASMTVASSIADLHSFVTLKNLHNLLAMGRPFWANFDATGDATDAAADQDLPITPSGKLLQFDPQIMQQDTWRPKPPLIPPTSLAIPLCPPIPFESLFIIE